MNSSQLAQQLADRLRVRLGDDILEWLGADPIRSIQSDLKLEVMFRQEARTRDGCGVDGSHVPGTSKIVVARSASVRRRNFTALHEAAHYLCFNDSTVCDEVDLHPDENLEETVANLFAADVLIPLSVRADIFGERGCDAAAVLELYRRTQASRSACCAAAIRYLPANGYIVLADAAGEVFFAAGPPHQYPISPGSRQPDTSVIVRAAQNGHGRGVDRLAYRTGNKTPEHNIDAVRDEEDPHWIYAVAVAGQADWPSSAMLDPHPAARNSVVCPNCDLEIQTWGTPCERCGDYRCPRCKQCGCPTRPASTQCPRCFMLVLPHLLTKDGCLNCP